MQHDRVELAFYDQEVSEWVDWMKSNLASGGIDLPSEETCVSFAAQSVRVAEKVQRISSHLPRSLRTTLIEAAVLHQCWTRQVKTRRRNKQIAGQASQTPIPSLDALAVIERHRANAYTVEASDGHRYRVNLPLPGREKTLGTEALCLEIAREIGLPTPSACLIFMNKQMAMRAGILRDCRATCLSSGMFCPLADKLCCHGVREVPCVETGETGRPNLPIGPRAFKDMVGRIVFDVWVLNALAEAPAFRDMRGRAEPVFAEFGHCLMDADWPRFVSAHCRERVPDVKSAERIRSHQQLDVWIRRIEEVDLEATFEHVIKLPSYWYGNRPLLLSAVVTKLDQRRGDLPGIIRHLIKTGYFRGIPKVMHGIEGTSSASISGGLNVRNFRLSGCKRRLVH